MLVEQHAIFESPHRDRCFAFAAVRHVYVQADGAAVGARVRVRHAREIAGDEGEEVCGYSVGAMVYTVTLAVHDIAFKQIAVREHDGKLLRVADERGGEAGHDVGAVDVVGDVAEALSFALRDEASVGAKNREKKQKKKKTRA